MRSRLADSRQWETVKLVPPTSAMEVLTSCAHQVGEELEMVVVSLRITEIQLASQ
jgi:hypothetical protein